VKLRWSEEVIPLKYYLGEIKLLGLSLSLFVLKTNLNNIFFLVNDDVDVDMPTVNSPELLMRSFPLSALQNQIDKQSSYYFYCADVYKRYYTKTIGSFDSYLANNYSSKSRSTLRRKVKNYLKNQEEDCFRVYKSEEEIAEFYQLARQVSCKTYQERLLDCGLPESIEFLEKARMLAREGLVRGYLLFRDGEPVSYVYSPIVERVAIYQYVGFDPLLSKLSPGAVLQWFILKSVFEEENIDYFDYTEGEGGHKSLFADGFVECADVYVLKKILRNKLIITSHKMNYNFNVWLVDMLDRIGIKKILKKMIRHFVKK